MLMDGTGRCMHISAWRGGRLGKGVGIGGGGGGVQGAHMAVAREQQHAVHEAQDVRAGLVDGDDDCHSR